jgi:hypothetical protein
MQEKKYNPRRKANNKIRLRYGRKYGITRLGNLKLLEPRTLKEKYQYARTGHQCKQRY